MSVLEVDPIHHRIVLAVVGYPETTEEEMAANRAKAARPIPVEGDESDEPAEEAPSAAAE
jgi:hypothetical protein